MKGAALLLRQNVNAPSIACFAVITSHQLQCNDSALFSCERVQFTPTVQRFSMATLLGQVFGSFC